MNGDDDRDEELGALLRSAAEYAARERPINRETRVSNHSRRRFGIVRRFVIASVSAAAVLVAAISLPGLSRHIETVALVRGVARDLSRSLIAESPTLIAEIPLYSEVESAAADLMESLLAGNRER